LNHHLTVVPIAFFLAPKHQARQAFLYFQYCDPGFLKQVDQ